MKEKYNIKALIFSIILALSGLSWGIYLEYQMSHLADYDLLLLRSTYKIKVVIILFMMFCSFSLFRWSKY